MAEYNGQYDSAINSMYNSLFGRDAAAGGLQYWGEALSNPDSGITTSNLKNSLIAGASGADLDYYNKSLINNEFNTLFGRDAADAGLDYYNDALKNKSTGVNYDNLSSTILDGASREDIVRNQHLDENNSSNTTTNNSNTNTRSSGSSRTNSSNTLPVTMPEVSLKTVTPYVPSYSETAQGILEKMLSSDSKYMQSAREAGERNAQSRGLLNSSLASQSAEKAAIDAALPIAQQDSQNIINAASEQNLVNSKAYQSAQLSAQEASQQAVLNNQQNKAASDLSKQEAEQQIELDSQQQEWANYRQKVELEVNQAISSMELASNEKSALSGSMETLGDNFQANLAAIQVDQKIGAESKSNAIRDLTEAYQANMSSLASVYGVTITWEGFGSSYSF